MQERPAACDTLEGIAAFWVSTDRRTLQRALDGLVREGVLQTTVLGGRIHFQLAPHGRDQAQLIAAAEREDTTRDGSPEGWTPDER